MRLRHGLDDGCCLTFREIGQRLGCTGEAARWALGTDRQRHDSCRVPARVLPAVTPAQPTPMPARPVLPPPSLVPRAPAPRPFATYNPHPSHGCALAVPSPHFPTPALFPPAPQAPTPPPCTTRPRSGWSERCAAAARAARASRRASARRRPTAPPGAPTCWPRWPGERACPLSPAAGLGWGWAGREARRGSIRCSHTCVLRLPADPLPTSFPLAAGWARTKAARWPCATACSQAAAWCCPARAPPGAPRSAPSALCWAAAAVSTQLPAFAGDSSVRATGAAAAVHCLAALQSAQWSVAHLMPCHLASLPCPVQPAGPLPA